MTKFPDNWKDIAWDKLPLADRQRAVDIIRGAPDWEELEKLVKETHAKAGENWLNEPPLSATSTISGPDGDREMVLSWHMFGGMAVRNYLRHKGFADDQLPALPELYGQNVSTWDDFYAQAIEAAAGLRAIADFEP